MRFHRRILLACIIATTAVVGLAGSPRKAFSAWTVGEPIVTYFSWGPALALTDSIAQQAVAGGYNLVWINDVSQLAIAKRYGLRAQLFDTKLTPGSLDSGPKMAQLDAMIAQYKASPAASAFYSYMVADEPDTSKFNDLRDLVGFLRDRDPDRMAFGCLFGNYAGNSTIGANSYSEYVNNYINTVKPSLLSYDHYPFVKSSDRAGYLDNLNVISTAARQAGVPFMNIVQAIGISPGIGSGYRVPNANELRFQVYTTLAYGAQGISYYCYPSEDPKKYGGLVPAADGTPTSVYTALTPLNKQFKNIATQCQSLKLIGDFVKGYSTTTEWVLGQGFVAKYNGPPGTTTLPNNSPFDVRSVSNSMKYSDGNALKGLLFGLFDKDSTSLSDATFALIVNLDYTASKTYTVDGPGLLSIFDATAGVWTATGQNHATLTLEPGGGVLVGLTSAVPEPSCAILCCSGFVAWRGLLRWNRKSQHCR